MLDIIFLAYDRAKFVVLVLLKIYDNNRRPLPNQEWILSDERTGEEYGRGTTDNRGEQQIAVEILAGTALDANVRFKLTVGAQMKTKASPLLGRLTQFLLEEWEKNDLAREGANAALTEELLRRSIVKGVNTTFPCKHCKETGECRAEKTLTVKHSCHYCRKKTGMEGDPFAVVPCAYCDGKGKHYPPKEQKPERPERNGERRDQRPRQGQRRR